MRGHAELRMAGLAHTRRHGDRERVTGRAVQGDHDDVRMPPGLYVNSPCHEGMRLMEELGPVLTQADFAGAAYAIWGWLTDGIDGPPAYARGQTPGQIEALMRQAASEWLALDPQPRSCGNTSIDGEAGQTSPRRTEHPILPRGVASLPGHRSGNPVRAAAC